MNCAHVCVCVCERERERDKIAAHTCHHLVLMRAFWNFNIRNLHEERERVREIVSETKKKRESQKRENPIVSTLDKRNLGLPVIECTCDVHHFTTIRPSDSTHTHTSDEKKKTQRERERGKPKHTSTSCKGQNVR